MEIDQKFVKLPGGGAMAPALPPLDVTTGPKSIGNRREYRRIIFQSSVNFERIVIEISSGQRCITDGQTDKQTDRRTDITSS